MCRRSSNRAPPSARQTLALLESMKLFSKVKSPADGVVVEVAAENESPVSVGQVLVRLRRN